MILVADMSAIDCLLSPAPDREPRHTPTYNLDQSHPLQKILDEYNPCCDDNRSQQSKPGICNLWDNCPAGQGVVGRSFDEGLALLALLPGHRHALAKLEIVDKDVRHSQTERPGLDTNCQEQHPIVPLALGA